MSDAGSATPRGAVSAPPSTGDPRRRALVVAIAAFSFGLVLLQTTAVNLALPVIREQLAVGVDGLQWAVSAYAVVVAGVLLPAGVVCDRIGASRALAGGLSLIVVGAAASASAAGVLGIIVGQAIAGFGAAFMLPAATAVLVEATPPGRERARAVGMLGVGGAVGFGLGPVVAGLVGGWLGWRGVFALPGACVLATLAAAVLVVPPSPRRPRRGPNPVTVTAVVLMVGGAAFLLIDGNANGWWRASTAIALAVVSALAVGLVRAGDAGLGSLLPPRLLRGPGFRLMLGLAWGHSAGIYGMLFVVALAVPAATGVSVATLSLLLVPQAIGAGCTAPLASRWVGRIGARRPLIVGCLYCAVGTSILTLGGNAGSVGFVAAGTLLIGIGGGHVTPALTTAVTMSVPPDLVGVGAGAFNAFRQLGTVGGVALIGGTTAIADPVLALRVAAVLAIAIFLASAIAIVRGWATVGDAPGR